MVSVYTVALLIVCNIPWQYRQCAGRAGRRGYDLLGKVVFYGLSMDRVQRLILSRLPSLQGHFPLTSTLVLRLFNLLHGSDYAEVSTRTVNNIMSLSQISLRSNIGQQQLLHHLRFSIEYLRRARLLDKEGRPMNLFAVAAHLYVSFTVVLINQLSNIFAVHGAKQLGVGRPDAEWDSPPAFSKKRCGC